MDYNFEKTENSMGCWSRITKFKVVELWLRWWNPTRYIAWQKSFELSLKGNHTPRFVFDLALICIGLEFSFYDTRHEDEKEEA